ncbi:histone-lysine N-methyltransferase PRDM7-like [Diabrotica virgifera virgifera]|uniref:SET domain-containing protein n=1 Tax=Diabrotica virgifera virgifera TaxID=50390 RepID=A0ABM5L0W7_DIAVI|nr:histone-lysine N-methyltransferase PRDM7-like [Diabrotica virgifera virgifera]
MNRISTVEYPPVRERFGNTDLPQKYPRRNITQKNYYEGEEPANDRYVYCDTCKKDYVDFCSNCGTLVVLEDTPIRMGVEMRAKKTAPKGILEVQTSKIHGLGVFALRPLHKGVRLGPYQGQITRVNSTKGYAWKLKDGRLVDASDEKISNYLRYVNCARNVYEQNVIAFQYRGQLYYRTSKMILK